MKKSIFLFFAAILCAIGMNAANLTGGTVLYLKPNSNWASDNAWFAMYLCNGSSAAEWVKMTLVEGETNVYTATVPAGKTHKNVIFCRMNKDNTTKLDWSNRWNQSGDLTWDGTNNCCAIKDGQWNCGTNVTWSTYTPPVTHTFAKNSTLYVDFRAITDKKGANYPKAGSVGIDYSANAGGTVIPVTFTADVKWAEGAEFIKTEKGGWASIPFKAPAAGQNCAQVAADGKSYTWTTFSEPSVTLSLDKTEADAGTEVTVTLTATADNVSGEVTYAFQYSTDNATWNNITATGNTATQTFAAETRYYKVTMTNGGTTKEATAKFSAIKFHVIGSWDGWAAHNEVVEGSKTITLQANTTYEYKITNGTWDISWGNDGTMTRENCTNWSFEASGNAKITTDEAGDYVFNVSRNAEGKVVVSVTYPFIEQNYYLTGNDAVFGLTNNNWTPNTIKMTWDEVNGIYTYTTPTLSANKNYVFRVTNGTWNGKWGYDKLNPAPENVLSFGDDKNICFMLAAEGTITVKFDGEKINLTTTSSFAAPVYTLVGDAAITGCHWDVNSAENQMVQDATDKNKYTLVKTVTAVAGDYDYKAIRNHSYEWEVEGDKLKIEKEGTGTVTYTLDIATPKLTAEVSNWVEESVAKDVKLVGIGEDKEFTEAADHLTTSVDVVLEANSVYSFNIIVNGVYLKNNGVMWRDNCTGWTFNSEGDKAHIITDLAGTYTFTWAYEGNKLSVTYPDGTNVPAPVFLAGEMNGWDRLATRLIPSADGKTASATITLNRNEKSNFRMVVGTEDWTNPGEMKRTNCTGWKFEKVTESNKDVNASILPDYTDEYTFTWTYAENKLSVTYPTEECTDCSGYYLVGSMNEWKQTADEFMKAEGTTVEISKELAAGSYEFKIKNGDDWYSDQDLTVTRSNSTSIAFDMKEGGNTHFTADIDGVYTFTYTTDQKKLTVTYPEIIIGDGDNSSVLNSLNGKTVDLKVTRSFASGTLYTLVLPFAMNNTAVTDVFGDDVELYDFTSLSENNGELILNFTEQATPAIAAGTPYLIKPETNANGFDLTGVTIKTATNPVVKTYGTTTITMQPILSAAAEDMTNGASQYWLAADNNLYNNVVSIKGLRVIFDVQTTKANVRARAAFNENVETGVEDLFTTDTPVKAIVNGQLIIIRDGVKYNVQGQVIR